MSSKTYDHSKSIYSAHEVGMIGRDATRRAAEHAQFGIGLKIPGQLHSPDNPALSEYFAPLLPWEICALQGQTSNGKSYFKDFWLRQIAAQLEQQERDEAIIDVHLEETIEAVAFQEYGRLLDARPADFARGTYTDDNKIMWAMTQIDSTPVWHIGDSAQRADDAPELTLSNIYRAIKALVSGGVTGTPVKPAVVSIDYLQALPLDDEVKSKAPYENQRRLQVAKDVFRLRAMTTHIGCPIIVPLQAKQKLDGANAPMMIPGTYDGMETSAIATRFDRVLSIWMPKTTYPVGFEFAYGSRTIKVTDDMAFLKVNKQRGGLPAGRVYELRADYRTHEYFDPYGGGAGK